MISGAHSALEQQVQARFSPANLKRRFLLCRCAQLKQSQLKQRRERMGAGRRLGKEVIDQMKFLFCETAWLRQYLC